MPFKRPAPPQHEPTSGYSSKSDPTTPEAEVPSKRSKVDKSAKALPNIKLYIVQVKLDGTAIAELFHLAERHCERLCQDIEDANVVLTAVTMRRRFERHVSWDVAVGAHSRAPESSLTFSSFRKLRLSSHLVGCATLSPRVNPFPAGDTWHFPIYTTRPSRTAQLAARDLANAMTPTILKVPRPLTITNIRLLPYRLLLPRLFLLKHLHLSPRRLASFHRLSLSLYQSQRTSFHRLHRYRLILTASPGSLFMLASGLLRYCALTRL